jgi:hypothetical protein
MAACPGDAGPGVLPSAIQALQKKYVALLEVILKEGVAAGEFDGAQVGGLATHLNVMGYAFMPPYRIVSNRKELVEHIDRYTEMLLNSLRPRGRVGGKP